MVKQLEVNGDQVIVGKNGVALVSSKSDPGAWHTVKAGTCDCKGFTYRGRCRHLGAVEMATTQPVPTVNATFALAARTLAGDFGGHRQREEWDHATIDDGESVGFAEWRERRAH